MCRAARGWLFLLTAAGLAMGGWPAHAQQTDTGGIIGSLEAGGMFGLGAHGSVGASLASPASKYLLPFIDFNYSPLTSYGFKYGSNLSGKGLYTSGLLDLNGGVKIRFPNTGNWLPYVGLGVGVLRFMSSTDTSGFGASASVTQTSNDIAGNASVGALYYITQHLGFGMEVKGYAAQHTHLVRVSLGVFFQIP